MPISVWARRFGAAGGGVYGSKKGEISSKDGIVERQMNVKGKTSNTARVKIVKDELIGSTMNEGGTNDGRVLVRRTKGCRRPLSG